MSTRDANGTEYTMARKYPDNRGEPAANTPNAAAPPHHDASEVCESDGDGEDYTVGV